MKTQPAAPPPTPPRRPIVGGAMMDDGEDLRRSMEARGRQIQQLNLQLQQTQQQLLAALAAWNERHPPDA